MNTFTIHPNVYATGSADGLLRLLEHAWVRDHMPGQGTLYIVSGYGTYNGGVRFYETFRDHVAKGGRIVSVFAGSTAQKLTSRQLVEEMLKTGAQVHIVSRKRVLHAKCYGSSTPAGERLVVTSGNFTGPGMSLNVEASLFVDPASTRQMGFSWQAAMQNLLRQRWDILRPTLTDHAAPAWQLLYDEYARDVVLDETEETTLLVTLSHADTARIQADEGTSAGKGTQYFWLSRDCYGFFPPLVLRNRRGIKATFSCIVRMHYIDLSGYTDDACRVTFEAENNLDFRLGTGPLKYTNLAAQDDLAAISRVGDAEYELRIFRQTHRLYRRLRQFATNFIGHRGKKYGYVDNAKFGRIVGVRLPTVELRRRA